MTTANKMKTTIKGTIKTALEACELSGSIALRLNFKFTQCIVFNCSNGCVHTFSVVIHMGADAPAIAKSVSIPSMWLSIGVNRRMY